MTRLATFDQSDLPPGMGIRFLRQPAVLARVGVTWITILRWEKQGRFPKRRKLGPNTVAWVEAEIEEWCASRAIDQVEEVA
jgi:prophage regulatory protein